MNYIRVFLLGSHWFRRQQASIFVIYRDAAQMTSICLIYDIHPLLYLIILGGEILLLNHIVINGIGYLPHGNQIFLQSLPGLFHRHLCVLYHLPLRQGREFNVHYNAQNQHNRNRNQGESQHDRGLHSLWF